MTLTEAARSTPVIGESEVVVLGGGPAGVTAAIAAARAGAATLLVERYGFLGGAGTAAMVSNFCGLYTIVDGEVVAIVRGIADDIVAGLRRRDGCSVPHPLRGRVATQSFDVSAYKLTLDELLRSSGANILFHTYAVGAIVKDRSIEALLIESKSGRGAIRGRIFIDASGDGDLCAWSGIPFEHDRDHLQFPTLMFRLGNVDTARALRDGRPRIAEFMDEAERAGKYSFTRRSTFVNPQPHDGEWRANVTQLARDGRAVDGIDVGDLTYGELDGRRQVVAFATFLREYVPGFERSYLLDIAPQIGIRETRRIAGVYRVTREDVVSARDFDDAVGANPWPVEKHVPGDIEWSYIEGRGFHQIPFGALVPTGIRNLLFAGRCLSAEPDAQASLRVSGPCFVMGQAVGTAAALANAQGIAPSEVAIAELQRRLRADGVFFGAQ